MKVMPSAARVMGAGRSATMARELDRGGYDAPTTRVRCRSATSTSKEGGGRWSEGVGEPTVPQDETAGGGSETGVYEECVHGDTRNLVSVKTGMVRY